MSCYITQVSLSFRTELITGHFPFVWTFAGRETNSWSQQLQQTVHVLKQPETITLHCLTVDIFMKCCVSLMSDVAGLKPSKKLNFCLVSSQKDFKMFFGKM